MGDEDYGRPLSRQVADQLRYLLHVVEVEPARWLVQKNQPSLRKERARHGEALLLPAGQGHGVHVPRIEKVERGKRRLCPLLGFPLLPAAQREHALVPDAVAEELVVDVLHHERDETPPGAARDLLPSDEDAARILALEAGDPPEQRALPRAVLAQDAQHAAGRNRHAQRGEHRPVPPNHGVVVQREASLRPVVHHRARHAHVESITRADGAEPHPLPLLRGEPQELFRRELADYAAFLDENGAVDEVRGEIEPVLGDDDGPALRDDGAHLVMQPLHGGRVEVRGGLVEHVHVGPRHVDGGEDEALALSAAHLGDVAPQQPAGVQGFHGGSYPCLDLRYGDPARLEPESELVVGREVEELALRVLEHAPDALGELVHLAAAGVEPADGDRAGHLDARLERRDQAVDAFRDGRLARSRASDEHQAFAPSDLEVDSVQDLLAPCRLAGDVLEHHDGLAERSSGRMRNPLHQSAPPHKATAATAAAAAERIAQSDERMESLSVSVDGEGFSIPRHVAARESSSAVEVADMTRGTAKHSRRLAAGMSRSAMASRM